MRKRIAIICVVVLLILDPWIASLIHCEILTAKFGDDELIAACEENDMIGEIDTLKVLERNPYFLKVYVKNAQGGHVMLLEKNMNTPEKNWRIAYWWTIWSRQGSASEFVWPYIR